ncbi:MAG TPA: hypothetical protein VMB19_08250 [Silvibacterium sp.]|nr:hypothetical protein [Silvibacterium sp.]
MRENGNQWQRAAVAAVLCVTMIMAGCSTAWISEAEEIVAALIPAAANLVTLVASLEGKTVSAGDLQTIQNAGTQAEADLQLVQSLIAAYEKADAATKPGILNQIESAITAAQANLQGLLPALHIQDAATQAKVTAVVGILLSEVESLAAIVPVVKSQPSVAGAELAARAAGKAPLSANDFVASYNATMTAKTGNADLDRTTAGLKIHAHGKVARWATAGVLQ